MRGHEHARRGRTKVVEHAPEVVHHPHGDRRLRARAAKRGAAQALPFARRPWQACAGAAARFGQQLECSDEGAQLASAVPRILEWRAGVVRGSAYMSARCHAHHDVKPSVGMPLGCCVAGSCCAAGVLGPNLPARFSAPERSLHSLHFLTRRRFRLPKLAASARCAPGLSCSPARRRRSHWSSARRGGPRRSSTRSLQGPSTSTRRLRATMASGRGFPTSGRCLP